MEKKFWTIVPKNDNVDCYSSGCIVTYSPRNIKHYESFEVATEAAKRLVQDNGDYYIMEVTAVVRQPIPPAEVVTITA